MTHGFNKIIKWIIRSRIMFFLNYKVYNKTFENDIIKHLIFVMSSNFQSQLVLQHQKLSFSIITQMSQIYSVSHSLTVSLAFSAISLLFVIRFGRSLRFCHLKFDKEAIYNGCRNKNLGFGGWVLNFKWFYRLELLWSLFFY